MSNYCKLWKITFLDPLEYPTFRYDKDLRQQFSNILKLEKEVNESFTILAAHKGRTYKPKIKELFKKYHVTLQPAINKNTSQSETMRISYLMKIT